MTHSNSNGAWGLEVIWRKDWKVQSVKIFSTLSIQKSTSYFSESFHSSWIYPDDCVRVEESVRRFPDDLNPIFFGEIRDFVVSNFGVRLGVNLESQTFDVPVLKRHKQFFNDLRRYFNLWHSDEILEIKYVLLILSQNILCLKNDETYFEDGLENVLWFSSNDEKSGSHLSEIRVEIVETFFQESPSIWTDPSILDKPETEVTKQFKQKFFF